MKIKHIITLLIITTSNTLFAINYIDSLEHQEHLFRFDSVISNYTINEACSSTIEKCLEQKSESSLAERLSNFIAWLILRNKNQKDIVKQLDKRVLSFNVPDTCKFTNPFIPPAGDPKAPVKIIAYVKASCSLCKRVVIPIHLAVNSPVLKGIANLEIRPMMNTLGNRALLAAQKQGKGWEYFLALEEEDRRLDLKVVAEIAKKIGLNEQIFNKNLNSSDLVTTLLKLRKEATFNNFNTAPTLYINNRRYQSYKDPKWLIDAIEYEYERTKENN